MRVLTASVHYVVAKVNSYVLLDIDLLPLQGEHWQTDQMMSAYFSLVATRFSTPHNLKMNLDFTTVGEIITGTGVSNYLAKKKQLPMSSVSIFVCNSLNISVERNVKIIKICRLHTGKLAIWQRYSALTTKTVIIGR